MSFERNNMNERFVFFFLRAWLMCVSYLAKNINSQFKSYFSFEANQTNWILKIPQTYQSITHFKSLSHAITMLFIFFLLFFKKKPIWNSVQFLYSFMFDVITFSIRDQIPFCSFPRRRRPLSSEYLCVFFCVWKNFHDKWKAKIKFKKQNRSLRKQFI